MDEARAYTHPSIDLELWEHSEHDPAVVIANGHNIKVAVRSGHLHVSDGPPRQPRTRQIPKVPRTVSRLAILGGHGMITAEAIRWLAWAEIPWSMLDTSDGSIIAGSGPARSDAALIRAQCRSADASTGLDITRDLLTAKLTGQAAVLHDVLPSPEAEAVIAACATELGRASSLDGMLAAEGRAATAYWSSWADRVAVPWSPADLVRIPAHWRGFSARQSLASGRNRSATDPVNAMLNYAYKVAETQAVIACHATGLHPGIGISHVDAGGRSSMALDLMEAARPLCDRLILRMLAPDGTIPYASGKPAYADRRNFTEGHDGQVRLIPPLTHYLASCAADISALLIPLAAGIARQLASETARLPGRRAATRLPGTHRGYPRNRLREGASVADIMPGSLWEQVEPLIPAHVRSPRGGPNRQISDRDMCCYLIGRHVMGLPWAVLPVRPVTMRGRLAEWDAAGAWGKIRQLAADHGHLPGLVRDA